MQRERNENPVPSIFIKNLKAPDGGVELFLGWSKDL